jgi:hypothetical protein
MKESGPSMVRLFNQPSGYRDIEVDTQDTHYEEFLELTHVRHTNCHSIIDVEAFLCLCLGDRSLEYSHCSQLAHSNLQSGDLRRHRS